MWEIKRNNRITNKKLLFYINKQSKYVLSKQFKNKQYFKQNEKQAWL